MNILSLLTGIPQAAADYFKRKMELKSEAEAQQRQIQAALTERKVELIKEGLHADMQWEEQMAQQAATSWKDEYVLLILSIPAWLCFIPKDFDEWQGGAYYVSEGFKALDNTPLWYQILLCTHFCATIGVRWWRRSQYDTP